MKILAKVISDEGLMSQVHKELLQLSNTDRQPIRTGRCSEEKFPKAHTQMVHRHVKRCQELHCSGKRKPKL